MGRTFEEVMAGLPATRREAIELRAEALLQEVEGLRALRVLAERSQEQIADALVGNDGAEPNAGGPPTSELRPMSASPLGARIIHRRLVRRTRRRWSDRGQGARR
jgi:hypothetical protein